MDKSFGQIVREKREERGLSQAELATLANTTQQSIDRIERDAVSRSRSAPEVAAALGIAFPLGTTAVRTAVEQAQQETIPRAELVGVNDLPIYVSVRAGSIDDSILVSPEPIDYVKRPEPFLALRMAMASILSGTRWNRRSAKVIWRLCIRTCTRSLGMRWWFALWT